MNDLSIVHSIIFMLHLGNYQEYLMFAKRSCYVIYFWTNKLQSTLGINHEKGLAFCEESSFS